MIPAEVGSVMEQYAQRLRERLQVEALILFGSRARGDDLAGSDYDVAVVSQAFRLLHPYRRRVLLLELWPHPYPVDVHGFTPEEFLALDRLLLWEIVQDGVAVVDTGVFAKARELLGNKTSSGQLERTPFGWRTARS